MICEYALDPLLVAGWHDPKEWAFYREAFADGTGRYGSTFPRKNGNKWKQSVRAQFRDLYPDATPESRAWQRLDALLERIAERMIERTVRDENSDSWLERVVEEHRARSFHGILSARPDTSVPEVITPDMLFSESPPSAWSVPPNPCLPRTSKAFAQALAPLLTRCKEALFIDPHFDPRKQRFREPLGEMLRVLWGPESCVSKPTVQLIMAEGESKRKRDPQWLLNECQQRLPNILPDGHSLTVTVLRQRSDGEKIHNRYILTRLAGVSFGTGLDVADHGEISQSDDLCRLSSEQLKKRWEQYFSAQGSDFDIAAGPQEISHVVKTVTVPRLTRF